MKNYKLTIRPKENIIAVYIEDWGIGSGKEMETLLESMTQWCKDSTVGRRMAWDQFYFKNQRDANLFILRWQ